MSLPAEGHQLKGISAKAYEHPADRAATAALKSIPHLDTVVGKIIEYGYERAIRRGVLGSAVRLGEDQLAAVWRAHARAYATLDLEPVPELYLTQYPIANALTIGAGRPMVVAAGAEAAQLDLDVFMRQGQDYREKASPFDRFSRLLIDLNLTHPMSVQRVHELMEWVKTGDYDRIVDGQFISRDEPLHPRA